MARLRFNSFADFEASNLKWDWVCVDGEMIESELEETLQRWVEEHGLYDELEVEFFKKDDVATAKSLSKRLLSVVEDCLYYDIGEEACENFAAIEKDVAATASRILRLHVDQYEAWHVAFVKLTREEQISWSCLSSGEIRKIEERIKKESETER